MANNNSRTYNSIKNISTSLIIQVFLIIVKFICRTVFINTLGNSYLGINGLFADILTMLSITELGIDSAMNYKLYKPLAENDVPRLQVLMKFYKNAYLVVGSVITILGLALIPFLPKLIRDYDSLAPLGINPEFLFILFLLQSSLSYLFFASDSAIIKADQKEYVIYISNFICTILMNLIQIIALVFLADFIVYVIVGVVFTIGQNLVNAVIARTKYAEIFQKTKEKISVKEVKDMFKDLGALFLGKVQQVVINATDNLVLSAFIGLSIVGMYSNYLLIFVTIKTVLQKIYSSTKASMGNLFATDDIEKKHLFFSVMNFITAILFGTAAVGVAVVGDEMIQTWIGSDYVIAFPFAVLLSLEIFTTGLKKNLYQMGDVAGLFRQVWYRPLIGIVINIVVSVTLVQICGIYGVVIGTVVADIISDICITPVIIFKYALKGYKPASEYFVKNAFYVLIIAVIGIGDWLLCHALLCGMGWLSISVHALICGCSIPIGLMIICYRSIECKYILNIGRRILLRKTH